MVVAGNSGRPAEVAGADNAGRQEKCNKLVIVSRAGNVGSPGEVV